ncbi:MAG TPA: rhodanese-like domain-containing protein [Candidatus Polarisedimenticolaceae bacterium]|nr:rhodanese-like domain-containing protein [Candidatus Polarisedimenticolaceae bacterium]
MDRWWPDGTETGSRLWQGVLLIVATGSLLGIAQNALVQRGAPKEALAWRYTPPTLDVLPDAPADGVANGGTAPSSPSAPGTGGDMNDPLGLGGEGTGFDIPDVARPLQIQITRVKQFFDAKKATIIDARDPEEYAAGHIPGAINLPHDQVALDPDRLEKFDPQGKPIIVYCGGGTCEASMNLGFALVAAGKHKVLVFMGGWPEWVTKGYPVAKGPTPEGA